jgi:hypothetical protein
MKRIMLFLAFSFLMSLLNAQTGSESYSFFIAGHTSGKAGVNNVGFHPAFKNKFDYIKSRDEIKFGILTGDIVSKNPTAEDWDEVDSDIDSLGLPVYFAVGNHDMEERMLFEERYGNTFYSFLHENDLFIILDPNIDGWNISGVQLEFLRDIVERNHKYVDTIFVLFHQLLWWNNDNIYSVLHPNSFEGRASTINFWTEIEPLFRQLSNKIIFGSGDMGAAYWSDDFMYDSYDNIEFISSGMGEGEGDNFVIINVDADKNISYDLICLNDSVLNCFGDLEDFQMSSTSTYSIDENPVRLYPNPVNNHFYIENLRDRVEVYQVVISNIVNQIVFKETINSNRCKIDVQNWKVKGLYFVQIYSADGVLVDTQKMIVY